jgi:hypothetical protein
MDLSGTSFQTKKQQLSHQKFSDLLDALKKNETLQILQVCVSEINFVNMCYLEKMLQVNQTLLILNLSECRIEDVRWIARGLIHNQTLHTLNLSDNLIQNVDPFENVLIQNPFLKKIVLDRNRIENLKQFCNGLSLNTGLTHFHCDLNPFLDEESINVHLPRALAQHQTLQMCVIGTTGSVSFPQKFKWAGKAWAKMLKVNRSLQQLVIDNFEAFENKKEIFKGLVTNTTLETLFVNMGLSLDDFFSAIKCLSKNKTLESLRGVFLSGEKREEWSIITKRIEQKLFFIHMDHQPAISSRNFKHRISKTKIQIFFYSK